MALFGFKYGETQQQHGRPQTQRWHRVSLRLKLTVENKKPAMASRRGMALHMTRKAVEEESLPTFTRRHHLPPPGPLTTTWGIAQPWSCWIQAAKKLTVQ